MTTAAELRPGSGCASCSGRGDDRAAANLPGQSALRWRIAPHGDSLARMRAALAGDAQPLAMPLARPPGHRRPGHRPARHLGGRRRRRVVLHGADRAGGLPAHRHRARLGAPARPHPRLRAAPRRRRPGRAGVRRGDGAAGSPEVVAVPAGTPVQTVPRRPASCRRPSRPPATLEARAGWNAIPAARPACRSRSATASTPSGSTRRTAASGWTTACSSSAASERTSPPAGAHRVDDAEQWDLRRVDAVERRRRRTRRVDAGSRSTGRMGYRRSAPLVAETGRAGATASASGSTCSAGTPPTQLSCSRQRPRTSDAVDRLSTATMAGGRARARGRRRRARRRSPDSWMVLEQPGQTEAYRVEPVTPDGATRFALCGQADARHARHRRAASTTSTAQAPRARRVASSCPPRGCRADLAAAGGAADVARRSRRPTRCCPGPPVSSSTGVHRRREAVRSTATARGRAARDDCRRRRHDGHPRPGPAARLPRRRPCGVRANVADATHGETRRAGARQRRRPRAFPRFTPRRPPLTYVRATTNADGCRAPSSRCGSRTSRGRGSRRSGRGRPHDRVYVVRAGRGRRQRRSSSATACTAPGCRPGAENVRATYRVGIGEDGAADARARCSLPVRRPRGIATVRNPAPAARLGPAGDARGGADQRSAAHAHPRPRRVGGRLRGLRPRLRRHRAAPAPTSCGTAASTRSWSPCSRHRRRAGRPARHRPARRRSTPPARPGAPRGAAGRGRLTSGRSSRIEVDPRHEASLVRRRRRGRAARRLRRAMDLATPLAASAVLVVAAAVPGVVA